MKPDSLDTVLKRLHICQLMFPVGGVMDYSVIDCPDFDKAKAAIIELIDAQIAERDSYWRAVLLKHGIAIA